MSELVTGHLGYAHVDASDLRKQNIAMFGSGNYILEGSGSEVIQPEMEITLPKMELMISGSHIRIEGNESITFDPTSTSQYRKDYIVAEYELLETGIETLVIKAIKGTVSTTEASASYPSLINSEVKKQFPLYAVVIFGSSVKSIDSVMEKSKSIPTIISEFSSMLNTMKQNLTPRIGTILENNTGTNPQTIYSGTKWKLYGVGKTTVCINTSDTDFNVKDKEGGSKTFSIAEANLPSHRHSIASHTHEIGTHQHNVNGGTYTTEESGNHQHKGYYTKDVSKGTALNRYSPASTGTTESTNALVDSAGKHTHSITIPSGISSTPVKSASTGGCTAFNTGYIGSGTAIKHLNPYITVYRWIRYE